MQEIICKVLALLNMFIGVIVFAFFLWTFWYGVKIETKGIVIELYGIGRYF